MPDCHSLYHWTCATLREGNVARKRRFHETLRGRSRIDFPIRFEKTLPMGLEMMERYPEVKEYHDELRAR